ncbi:radical SAM protein [Azospirillum sp.]|uniref:radical SAM protein n=1 Tax=Azospirillum sp. TaxID=34012 RepID=UPI002D430FDB|nr:radical SAM protein [Azospirillum sp.]HYD64514.1 radical SAM protein [Azospirillum sp.]
MDDRVTVDTSFRKTTKRVLTRRGVLWLGQTCNIRCHFCYFLDRIANKDHPEHAFMPFDKAKAICDTLRFTYGNNAIDIQGGEPTLYKPIYDLVSHCRAIGLAPTLISNAILLADMERCKKLQEAGVQDLLLSIQGIGDTYDRIVGVPGGSVKQMRALDNLMQIGLPFRFNVVLSKPVLTQLEKVAELAVTAGARVVNFLTFNPFEDQAAGGKRSGHNVPGYTDVAGPLNRALDILEAAGIEANVRYFPLCMVEPRHRKSMYNFQQLSYDLHEWDYASWSWTGQQAQRMAGGELTARPKLRDMTYPRAALFYEVFPELDATPHEERDPEMYRDNARLRAGTDCKYRYAAACDGCSAKAICDGFHGDYASIFGLGEARPIVEPAPVDDPTHYIRHQEKVVEAQDLDWAL